jgi:rhodanese-related sulfurtransferase
MLPLEVTPQEVKRRLDAGEKVRLIDCREAFEWQLTRIDGSEFIPMNTIPARLAHLESLADGHDLVVFCHHGMRSMQVAHWLREKGLENVQSMAGGIDRWSAAIDPQVPRY